MSNTKNQTIQQTTDALKTFFKTENVIYQAKTGYFVHMTVNGVVMKEVNEFLSTIGLSVSMVRAMQNQKLSLFLESA